MRTFIFITFLLLIAIDSSQACSPIQNNDFELVSSYQFEKQSKSGGTDVLISGCRDNKDKFFIVNTKATYTNLKYIRISTDSGEVIKDGCYIKNTPFEYSKPADFNFNEIFKMQNDIIHDCLQVTVKDERGIIDIVKDNDVKNTENKEKCIYENINESTVNVWGSHCVFKIAESSRFKVNYSITPACTRKEFLKAKFPNAPGDYHAEVSFNMADDLTPGTTNFELLGKSYGRLSILPDSSIMPVSTYFGSETARWPLIYSSDVSFGQVSMRKTFNPKLQKDYFDLRLPFVVNNNCEKMCSDGMCSSPCDFKTPIVASITLKKRKANESIFKFIDWWYQGNIVPGNYLGMLSLARSVYSTTAEINDEFYVKAEFSSPSISYMQLNKLAKRASMRISKLKINKGSVGKVGLGTLGDLTGQILPINTLPELSLGDGTKSFDTILSMLRRVLGTNKNWPPYYDKVCKYGHCVKSKEKFITLELKFKVARVSPSGRVLIREIVSKKSSPIFGSSVNSVTELPRVRCE